MSLGPTWVLGSSFWHLKNIYLGVLPWQALSEEQLLQQGLASFRKYQCGKDGDSHMETKCRIGEQPQHQGASSVSWINSGPFHNQGLAFQDKAFIIVVGQHHQASPL